MLFYDSFSISYSENQSENPIQPRGQISTDDLSLVFYISGVFNEDDEFEHLFVQFYYEWLNIPVFRYQDPIYVTWNEDKFRLEDDTFYKIDKYSGVMVNTDGTHIWYTDETKSLEEGYACASPSGVAWYADLTDSFGITITELYGYGCFRLVAAHDATITYGMSETLYANYVHPTFSFGASISVGALGSFDISCLGGYDERGTQKTFTVTDGVST